MSKKKEEVNNMETAFIADKIIEAIQACCSHTAYSPLDEKVHYKKLVEKFDKLVMSDTADPGEIVKLAIDIVLHKRWNQMAEPKHVFYRSFNTTTGRDVVKCNICGRNFVDYQTLEDVVENANRKIAEMALMKGYSPNHDHECHCEK